jgi:phospholipid/cholesterol/gamma-HCH transport system substrate-binding protein
MARTERSLRVKRRLQGVGFLAVVALLLGFTIAVYNKSLPWQAADKVTLNADRIGNQLVVPADVKLDGILVGRVSGVHVSGNHAVMTLQIDKGKIKEIPADVEARILPKTLFGEKFVDLVIPDSNSGGDSLHAGSVIQQDHSKTAIELQTVFNDLVPLLRTLKPAELSIALSNLADALRGRGDALGHNLQLVNTYFTKFNTDLPNFNHDISGLADLASNYADATPNLLRLLHNFSVTARTFTVKQDTYARFLASNYADATPDLLTTLRNFTVNAKTFTQKQGVYAQFLTGTQGFAEEATKVFGDNANRLITLSQVSKPVLDLYASFSDVLECLPNGLAIYDRTRLEQTFSQGPYLHITLTPVGDRGAYKPTERPKLSQLSSAKPPPGNDNGCYGLPYGSRGLKPVNPALFKYPGQPPGNYRCSGTTEATDPTCPEGGASTGPSSSTTATRSSALVDEQNLIAGLFTPMVGAQQSDAGLEDLLLGPMLRGMNVGVSL